MAVGLGSAGFPRVSAPRFSKRQQALARGGRCPDRGLRRDWRRLAQAGHGFVRRDGELASMLGGERKAASDDAGDDAGEPLQVAGTPARPPLAAHRPDAAAPPPVD